MVFHEISGGSLLMQDIMDCCKLEAYNEKFGWNSVDEFYRIGNFTYNEHLLILMCFPPSGAQYAKARFFALEGQTVAATQHNTTKCAQNAKMWKHLIISSWIYQKIRQITQNIHISDFLANFLP